MSTSPSAVADGILGGRYRLGPVIGRGGMALVHRATDLQLGREVAVKLFRSDVAVAVDPRRIQAEIRMLASVNHPGLVVLHDASAGDDTEPPFLVMELVEGEDLGRLLPVLSPAELASVAAQVAAALAHVHERGIMHRDVKPANILVIGRGSAIRAKLADLGIARLIDGTRMTATGTLLGTAAYLSPEQVLGEHPGPASDVYALGLLVLEGLTGEHPFPGTRAESLAARTSRPPRLPAGLSPGDAALLAGITARNPGERLSAASAEAGFRAWSSPGPFRTSPVLAETEAAPAPTLVLSEGGATAPLAAPIAEEPEGAHDAQAGTPPRRVRRGLMAAGAAVALVAAVGGGLLLARPPEQPAPSPAPSYPVVEGQLGEHLEQLQESVVPE
ncbi:serine/threonine-protein kinase [Naasia sp. SYSU D00948]|uniref:serine/threonine-protein kinase n=1 Tax=Naasia sp. SYSU D00948 TaxID=2817379 RepID=UPI001B3095F6|nr:serine/threonine-protein kinase [Naasia sp. SYSU D00948]